MCCGVDTHFWLCVYMRVATWSNSTQNLNDNNAIDQSIDVEWRIQSFLYTCTMYVDTFYLKAH